MSEQPTAAGGKTLDTVKIEAEIAKLMAETSRQLAEQQKFNAEQAKLGAKQSKLHAEQLKLQAEASKLTREKILYPLIAFATAAGAVFAGGAIVVRLLG
jgi:hypothetical protein